MKKATTVRSTGEAWTSRLRGRPEQEANEGRGSKEYKNLYRDVAGVQKSLFVFGSGDEERTMRIYQSLITDPLFKDWRGDADVDSFMIDTATALLYSGHCKSKGTRSTHVQRAIDHLLTFLTPANVAEQQMTRKIARRLGVLRKVISKACGLREKANERGLVDPKRIVRYDKRDYSFVRDLSHNEEVSRFNTFARKRKKVECEDGSVEFHDEHVL